MKGCYSKHSSDEIEAKFGKVVADRATLPWGGSELRRRQPAIP